MVPQIAGMLKEIGRESLVILYTPSIDHSFSVLMRQADHIIEITPVNDISSPTIDRSSRQPRNGGILPTQQTLEVT
jgi:hypothetical protein